MNLDEIVRSVPGVLALYSAGPAVVTSARQLVAGAGDVSLVSVRENAGGTEIIASIGVGGDEQAPRIAAAVSAAILAAVPDGSSASVHVRVSRVLG